MKARFTIEFDPETEDLTGPGLDTVKTYTQAPVYQQALWAVMRELRALVKYATDENPLTVDEVDAVRQTVRGIFEANGLVWEGD
jgi:hypothetical protein